MSEASRQKADALFAVLADEFGNNSDQHKNFWIMGRPFIAWYGCDYSDDEVDPEFPVDAPLGFVPMGQVGVAAMCGQTVDHILLAALATRLSAALQGAIWMSGDWKPEFAPSTSDADGLVPIGLHSYLVGAKFIDRWIERPNFRLPK